MMKSMTGFGRSDFRDDHFDLAIEIKTINHRYRDFFLKTPKLLNPIEEKMKSLISKRWRGGELKFSLSLMNLMVKTAK